MWARECIGADLLEEERRGGRLLLHGWFRWRGAHKEWEYLQPKATRRLKRVPPLDWRLQPTVMPWAPALERSAARRYDGSGLHHEDHATLRSARTVDHSPRHGESLARAELHDASGRHAIGGRFEVDEEAPG